MPFPFLKQPVREQLYTVAFYNPENLFDTSDDPNTLDDDFTLQGFNKWTPIRYNNKVDKLARDGQADFQKIACPSRDSSGGE